MTWYFGKLKKIITYLKKLVKTLIIIAYELPNNFFRKSSLKLQASHIKKSSLIKPS